MVVGGHGTGAGDQSAPWGSGSAPGGRAGQARVAVLWSGEIQTIPRAWRIFGGADHSCRWWAPWGQGPGDSSLLTLYALLPLCGGSSPAHPGACRG